MTLKLSRDQAYLVDSNNTPPEFSRAVLEPHRSFLIDCIKKHYRISLSLGNEIVGLNTNLSNNLLGHYRIVAQDCTYHLSVRSKTIGDTIELVNYITKNLAEAGILVPTIVKTTADTFYSTVSHGDSPLYLILDEFIEHRYFDGSQQDFLNISKALSNLHNALKALEAGQTKEIIKRSKLQRNEAAKARQFVENILDSESIDMTYELQDWVKNNLAVLEHISTEFDPYLFVPGDRQPIHGDLHPGNIGIHEKDGRIVFFDFETATSSYHSITTDLAKAMIRLFLMAKRLDNETVMLDFLESYGVNKSSLESRCQDIIYMWKQLSYDNISRGLYACHRRNYLVPEVEFSKYRDYLEITKELTKSLIN